MARPKKTIVLVAHGSRSPASQVEIFTLTEAVSKALPRHLGLADWEVELGYLELSDPPASEVLTDVLAGGCSDVIVIPLMLYAAGHSKSDVPAVVLGARERFSNAKIHYGRPLGVDHALLTVGSKRLARVGGSDLPLAVMSRGTSDPDANADAYKAARLLAEMNGSRLLATGFSGVTWPSVSEALHELAKRGAEKIVVFAWFLATGVLIDKMQQDYEQFSSETGIEVIDAGYLGPEPEIVELVMQRITEVIDNNVVPNCDACLYRRPFPGLSERVGQQLGVGHSHLALEHRSHGHLHIGH